MLSSLQCGSRRDFNPESTDREEGSVVTQNNHLVGARLDRTRTSRIRYLSGEFQTVSGRNRPTDAGWETGTDLTAPRGRPRTSPQQLRIFLEVLTSCPPRCGSVGLRAELGWSKARLRFFLWSSGASPISPLLENRAGKIDFFPGLPGILVSVVCRGQCCSGESLACFFPARPG